MALLIAAMERHPHEPYLNPDSPLVAFMSCIADSAPECPKDLKKAIRKVEESLALDGHKVDRKALKELEEWWVTGSVKDGILPPNMGKMMISTSQAIDIIGGGLKVNALASRS
jgi:Gly-Xaa carboxypeptidase